MSADQTIRSTCSPNAQVPSTSSVGTPSLFMIGKVSPAPAKEVWRTTTAKSATGHKATSTVLLLMSAFGTSVTVALPSQVDIEHKRVSGDRHQASDTGRWTGPGGKTFSRGNLYALRIAAQVRSPSMLRADSRPFSSISSLRFANNSKKCFFINARISACVIPSVVPSIINASATRCLDRARYFGLCTAHGPFCVSPARKEG